MITFIFIMLLVCAALLTRVSPALSVVPVVGCYLIASFCDFRKSGDRSFMGILALAIIILSVLFVVRSWL